MKKILLMFAALLFVVSASFAQKNGPQPKPEKQPRPIEAGRPDKLENGHFDKPEKGHPHANGVLVLVAHPNLKESTANKALAEVAQGVENVEVVDLYSLKKFNVDEFKEKVAGVRAIVFQFPFYYASAPAKMKEWIDDVFYMFSKESIQGKALLVAVTTGSEESAYRSGGRNMFTVDELLRPYQLTANHSGMVWQTPFVVYGMSTKEAEKNLSAACKSYKTTLETLVKSVPNGARKISPAPNPLNKQNARTNGEDVTRKKEMPAQRSVSPRK